MIVESVFGGLIIGFLVSFSLLRFFNKIPTKDPIPKSMILSLIVMIIITLFLQGPAVFLAASDALRYFLLGTCFNALRIFALGITIGYLFTRLE